MAERGTMYQLRNLIRHTNVSSDPQNNMNAAEDYLLLLLHTHVVAAANTVMKFNPQTSVHDLVLSTTCGYPRLTASRKTNLLQVVMMMGFMSMPVVDTWSHMAWIP